MMMTRGCKTACWSVVVAACIGCHPSESILSNSWKNALLDPTRPGNFREEKVSEILKSISFRDKPTGIPGAVEPTPADLVATLEEYRIASSDTLRIQILDFLVPDAESEFMPTVDELGRIYIPQLNLIHVEGLTTHDLQAEIVQQARNAGIFAPDQEPTVIVTAVTQQNRIYNLSGATMAPGPYRIPRPDFRLRDAVNQAGGLGENVKSIYIFRNEPRPTRVVEPGSRAPRPAEHDIPLPPVAPMSDAPGSPPGADRPDAEPGTRPQDDQLALPPDEVERLLIEAIAPGAQPEGAAPQTRPADPQAPTDADAPFIYVNDGFKEVTPPSRPGPESVRDHVPSTPPVAAETPAGEAVDWEELAYEGQQRVIRIPAEKLRLGDISCNIVIRNQDWIRLDQGPEGVFYVSGEVNRPGVYSLSGQQMTLRQAITASGGLNPLAWPSRCEIIRRIDDDREEMTQWNLARVMEMQDPDFFLKPNDHIHVGTHAIAPLLATIRNAFRLTYGFGFVYDRNFADIDAVTQQSNPNDRRRVERAARFPGLFP